MRTWREEAGWAENERLDQVARLADLSSPALPAWFSRHLYGSHIAQSDDSPEPWCELMRRYRAEWLPWIEHGRRQHLKWAELVSTPKAA